MIVKLDTVNYPYGINLCSELHAQSTFSTIPFDYYYMMNSIKNVIDNPSWVCHLAIDEDEIFCGIVAGYVTTFFFSPKILAVEACWYVREGTKKRTKLGLLLMKTFINWAFNEKHAEHIQTGDLAGINSLAVDRAYRHLGFTRQGTSYKLEKKNERQ